MVSRARMIFIILFVTGLLVGVVHLRTESRRVFNRCRQAFNRQGRLKQQLWQKQIELESLVNPDAVSRQVQSRQSGQTTTQRR